MSKSTTYGINGKITTECLSAALVQMIPKKGVKSYEDIDLNVDHIIAKMEQICIGCAGVDLIVTPESSMHGFSNVAIDYPISEDSPHLKRLQKKCAELKVWLVVGAFMKFKDSHFVHNCAITISDKGEIANIYSKSNPWTPLEPSYPGDEIKVFNGPKGSKIATIICFDGDFVDTWRKAGELGANVIIRISEYMIPHGDAYEITNRAGAYFNHAYVLATNTCQENDLFCLFGRSMAVNYDGQVICEAPVGIPYVLKVDIFPGLCDHLRANAFEHNILWQTCHRGASDSEYKGIGVSCDKIYACPHSDKKGK